MTEIHHRLRELGEHMRAWNPNDKGLSPSTLRRIERRRRATILSVPVVVVALIVTAGLGFAARAPGPRTVPPATGGPSVAETQEPAASPDRSSVERLDRDDFFGAIWPEDSRHETAQGCSAAESDSFRSDAVGTAEEFGRAVLDWDEGTGAVRTQHDNSKQVVLNRDSASEGAVVELSLVEYVEDCWSVQAVHPGELAEEARMPVMWDRKFGEGSNPAHVISIAFDAPDGTFGRIELEYGNQRETRRFGAGDVGIDRPLVFTLEPIDPYDAGHAMILFEDGQGKVRTAVGVPFLPQKGGARSDGLP